MKLNQTVLIIDDVPDYAEKIEQQIIQHSHSSDVANYNVSIFCDTGHFRDAKKHIQDAILKKNSIDLIFTDYNLEVGNGIELLNLFKNSRFNPYRVLHSHTDRRLFEHQRSLFKQFDEFSLSDDSVSVSKTLANFEQSIIKSKLWGNRSFYPNVYMSEANLRPPQNIRFGAFKALDIMYIETGIDDDKKILYRTDINDTLTVSRTIRTSSDYSHNKFLELNSDVFIKLNRSQSVNLLWVSKIDWDEKIIRFIMPNSMILEQSIFSEPPNLNKKATSIIANNILDHFNNPSEYCFNPEEFNDETFVSLG